MKHSKTTIAIPPGETIREKLQENGFMNDVKEGFQAAVDRSKEMTRQKGV